MRTTPKFEDWIEWLNQVASASALMQLGAIVLAALSAYVATRGLQRLLAGDEPAAETASRLQVRDSMLFGRRTVDGVLFPLLWLVLVYVAVQFMHVQVRYSLFRLAIPLLVALVVIRVGVKLLRAAFEEARWVRRLESTVSWGIWLCAALWMTGVLDVVLEMLEDIKFSLGSNSVSLLTLLQGVVIAGCAVLTALWLSALLESRLMRHVSGSALSLRKIISNALRVVLLFIAVIVAMSATGIDLTALSVFGGALGVGIGLGLQKLAANYVSGFVLLAERSIRIGDVVKVDGFEGRITDITARYTVIRALGGVEAIVPNETMVSQRVENNSLADRNIWVSTTVAVGYDSDAEQVQDLLIQAALSNERVLRTPAPVANLESFGADGLEFRLGFWIGDPENGTGVLRSDINRQILKALRAHHIEIPYPQRVLHHVGFPPAPEAPPPAPAEAQGGASAPSAKAADASADKAEGRC